jgi:hypothetical protein
MMLIAAVFLSLGVMVRASSSVCIPTVTTVPVPSSIETEISSAEVYAPSLTTIGSVISTFELSSPTLATVETVIEYYESSYASLVSELESIYSYPSLYTDETITELTTAYPTLASAVSGLISAELTQTNLAAYQSTLQSLEVSYSTILTVLTAYTDIASPSVYTASLIISQATLTSPSILATVIAVSTAISTSPTVSSAVSYLSYAIYTVPSSVASEVLTIIYSPSTVGASTVSSLESCYPTLYSELTYVTAFTYAYPSIVTALTAYLSAASTVSSLGSAVSTIVSYEMPTLSYEVSVLTAAISTQSDITEDLSVLTYLTAESPSLAEAESTIEGSFYASPSIAYTIYYALDYPSLITNPTAVSYYEESHESFVSAIDTILSFESYYTSSASMLSSIEQQLTTAFASYGTLLTAYSYVEDVTSPEEASATEAIYTAKTVVSDLTYVLSTLVSVISYNPSLSCAQSVIEYYATAYPSIAAYLWSVLDSDTYVAYSEVSTVESIIASYPSLASAEDQMLSAATYSVYPFSVTLESSFIYAAASDSSLLSQYETFSYYSSAAASSWSVCSSSSSY